MPEKYFEKPLVAINIFEQAGPAPVSSLDYLKLQCEIRGVSKEDLFWTMIAGVRYDCVYDALLHFLKDTDFFDEFLNDSRLVKFVQEVWIGLDPAINNLFWFTEVGKLMDRWRMLGHDGSWKWGHRGDKKNVELKRRLYDAIFEKCPEVLKQYYDENVGQKMSEILDEPLDDFGMFQPLLQFFRMFKKKAAAGDEKAKAMFEDMAKQLVDCI